MAGKIISINTSTHRGEKKQSIDTATLIAGLGIRSDVQAGSPRQISLLAKESIDKASVDVELVPGIFGENLTTEGINLTSLRVGDRLRIGPDVLLQIYETAKVCSSPCTIHKCLEDCIMSREGIFAKVLKGGDVKVGDSIENTTIKVGAVLTSSDRCASGEGEDESGRMLIDMLDEMGIAVADYTILPDEAAELAKKMKFLADRCLVDLILTTGGTGFTSRDRMPEATLAVVESPAPGIAEAIRYEGLRHTPFACISRGVSGLRGRTLIVNLPSSKKAIKETDELLRAVIPHTLEAMRI